MKPEELLDAFGSIDPEYVEEAEIFRKQKTAKRNWGAYAAAAASICVLMTGGYLLVSRDMDDGKDTSSATSMETMDGMQEENLARNPIPQKIYVEKDCYELMDSEESYEEQSLTCLGELGEKGSRVYADSQVTGIKVYRIDSTRIMVEIEGKYYTYKK